MCKAPCPTTLLMLAVLLVSCGKKDSAVEASEKSDRLDTASEVIAEEAAASIPGAALTVPPVEGVAIQVAAPGNPAASFLDVNDLPEPTRDRFTVTGLGGAGGMYCPTISPFDPDLMFIACDMSGSYYSHDGGKSWALIQFTELRSSRSTHPFIFEGGVLWAKDGRELKLSKDHGVTWQAAASRDRHARGLRHTRAIRPIAHQPGARFGSAPHHLGWP